MLRRSFIAGAAALAGSLSALPEVAGAGTGVPSHLPPGETYGRLDSQGNWRPVRLFADGITRDEIDFAWNVPRGSKEMALVYPLRPGDPTAIEASYFFWDDELNSQKLLGSFPIRWAANPLRSPSVPQVIVPLGDSTMQARPRVHPDDPDLGEVTEGCWLNEVSRQLTGVGAPLEFYAFNPASGQYEKTALQPALELNNLTFVGTRGRGPIRHEGRSSWSVLDYLSKPIRNGVRNAFWNREADGEYKFDLGYYLRQNQFMAPRLPGGALRDFSNVTVAIWLGWNDVYSGRTDAEIEANAGLLLDRIHETAPGAKVVWFGMIAPPDVILKILRVEENAEGDAVEGTREVSPRTIFEIATRRIGMAYRAACASRPWATFYQVSHLVNPETAYPKTSYPISPRSFEVLEGSYDFVHPQAHGYADFADVVANYFAYTLCSGGV